MFALDVKLGQDVVSVEDISEDLKEFKVEIARTCSYVKDRISVMQPNDPAITYGFHMCQSNKVRHFTQDNKSFLEVKLHLLKGAIESVAGEGFICHCYVYSDGRIDGYYWNIKVHTKENLEDAREIFRIAI